MAPALSLPLLFETSCSHARTQAATALPTAGQKLSPHESHPDDRKPPATIAIKQWSFRDGREFRDRNGDGIVDWQASGSARYSDGFGIYKEDNDFDGFYDRQFESGGYSGAVNYDWKIHEPVPPIHRIYPPTQIETKAKGEQEPPQPAALRNE